MYVLFIYYNIINILIRNINLNLLIIIINYIFITFVTSSFHIVQHSLPEKQNNKQIEKEKKVGKTK
jgi:hypothetical protein